MTKKTSASIKKSQKDIQFYYDNAEFSLNFIPCRCQVKNVDLNVLITSWLYKC